MLLLRRFIAFPAHADQFGYTRLLHGDSVKHTASLHRLTIVRDDDELRLAAHLSNQPSKPSHVRFVQRRVDFVQNTEWARLILEDRYEERQRGHGFLAARQQ